MGPAPAQHCLPKGSFQNSIIGCPGGLHQLLAGDRKGRAFFPYETALPLPLDARRAEADPGPNSPCPAPSHPCYADARQGETTFVLCHIHAQLLPPLPAGALLSGSCRPSIQLRQTREGTATGSRHQLWMPATPHVTDQNPGCSDVSALERRRAEPVLRSRLYRLRASSRWSPLPLQHWHNHLHPRGGCNSDPRSHQLASYPLIGRAFGSASAGLLVCS